MRLCIAVAVLPTSPTVSLQHACGVYALRLYTLKVHAGNDITCQHVGWLQRAETVCFTETVYGVGDRKCNSAVQAG